MAFNNQQEQELVERVPLAMLAAEEEWEKMNEKAKQVMMTPSSLLVLVLIEEMTLLSNPQLLLLHPLGWQVTATPLCRQQQVEQQLHERLEAPPEATVLSTILSLMIEKKQKILVLIVCRWIFSVVDEEVEEAQRLYLEGGPLHLTTLRL
jgi:hypothetical protein